MERHNALHAQQKAAVFVVTDSRNHKIVDSRNAVVVIMN